MPKPPGLVRPSGPPMWHEIRLFLMALQAITRLPVPAWVGGREEWVPASARHVPGVGLVVGGAAALTLWLAAQWWPALVSVLLCMAVTVWMTGAVPEGGLAGTCDRLGRSASRRERGLATLKDSRLGTCGVVALVFVLALKAATLYALATRDLLATLAVLPLAHAWSRSASLLMLRLLPGADDPVPAEASLRTPRPDGLGLAVALMWAVLAGGMGLFFLPGAALAAAAAGAAVVTLWMARWLQPHPGGFTGEALGATQQFTELAVYLAVLAMLAAG